MFGLVFYRLRVSVSLIIKFFRKEIFIYVRDYSVLKIFEIRIDIESILFLKYEDSVSYIFSVEDNV